MIHFVFRNNLFAFRRIIHPPARPLTKGDIPEKNLELGVSRANVVVLTP